MSGFAVVKEILDKSRWAPSGDNTQPWRFEIIDAFNVVIHGFDTRDHCVYDLDGHPSQLSIGALLETISIAASAHALETRCVRRLEAPVTAPTFDVKFVPNPEVPPSPLADCIVRRSVQRRAMQPRALSAAEKRLLEQCVGPGHSVVWLEGAAVKLRAALLMFRSAKLRLTIPEAYRVHRDVIEWNARYSADRIPDQALGADPLTVRLMRFVMRRWERVQFFNTYLAGTWAPRIEMDFIPALACGAHFVLLSATAPRTLDDYVAAGRVVQRFWLTVTQLGLVMQPELTPLIFSRYARERRQFSTTAGTMDLAARVAARLGRLVGADAARRAVFMGRVGAGKAAVSRSTRIECARLMAAPTANRTDARGR